MKLFALGKNISNIEIGNISKHGLWLLVKDREYYLPYEKYPWFKGAKLSEIYNVRLLHGLHLHWPDLDVDLELASLEKPKEYPLIYKS